jgi:hypothetical protein
LRLLLDEMYPTAIAEQLRRRGHPVDAVTERAELRGLPDADLFSTAWHERRAIVTENIVDFNGLADEHDARGTLHHGLVFVDPAKYPRGSRRTTGRMVTALERLLRENPAHKATSLRHWL